MASSWKKSVGKFIDTTNEVMDATNKVVNNVGNVVKAANDARATYRHYEKRKGYRDSEEGKEKLAKAERIEKIDAIVFRINVILVVSIIVATIALCMSGNDIVLKLLHI